MMTEFGRGVLFAVGLIMFGKGMYGLGKLKERHDNAKAWEEMEKQANKLKKILEDIQKKHEEQDKEGS